MNITYPPARKTFIIMCCLSGLLLLMASCLKDMPDSVPQHVVWDPELAFPLGEDRFGLNSQSGFDTTLFDPDTITDMPKWVAYDSLVMHGRINFDLESFNQSLDDVNRILFRINIYNGFPNVVIVQAYFSDASDQPIDSMFTEGAIPVPPGKVQGNGETIDPSLVRRDVFFDREQIGPLENATAILLQAVILIHDVDDSLIPYYPLYHMDVVIGSMLDLTIEF